MSESDGPKTSREEIAQEIRASLIADEPTMEALDRLLAREEFWQLAQHCEALPVRTREWMAPDVLALRLVTIREMDANRLRAQRQAQRERIDSYHASLKPLLGLPRDVPNAAREALEDSIRNIQQMLPPEDVLPPTGRPATAQSVRYRLIGSLIPKSYAESGTRLHKVTVEAIARALGIFEKGAYSDIFGAAGIRSRPPKS